MNTDSTGNAPESSSQRMCGEWGIMAIAQQAIEMTPVDNKNESVEVKKHPSAIVGMGGSM